MGVEILLRCDTTWKSHVLVPKTLSTRPTFLKSHANNSFGQTVDPLKAPDTPEDFTLFFEKGLPVKLISQGKTITDSVGLFLETNAIARRHGVGRIDIVENRFSKSFLPVLLNLITR
jgi:hypothetical protein